MRAAVHAAELIVATNGNRFTEHWRAIDFWRSNE